MQSICHQSQCLTFFSWMATQTSNCGMLLTSPTKTSENQRQNVWRGPLATTMWWTLLTQEQEQCQVWHAKITFQKFITYCYNYEAKDIGQRSVHMFQDEKTHSLQKSPKVLLLYLTTMHKHGSWHLLLIYTRLMIGLQIVLLCITWLIDKIFSTIFKRF
jgi:hypothetical protein